MKDELNLEARLSVARLKARNWNLLRFGMDWDDELDEMMHGADSAGSGSGLDPMDISNPARAYFLLSDDAQDEIIGTDKKRMKCRSCGHTFVGDIYDRCPECFSSDTEQMPETNDDVDW